MRVVITAWHLRDPNVGIGRYCRGLIEGLGRVDQHNEYEVLLPVDRAAPPAANNLTFRTVTFPMFKRRFWEQMAPLMAGRHDLLHFPYDAAIAWKRAPFVVTIHDVKPLIFSELRSRRNLSSAVARMVIGDKWAKIDHVITDSECSRRDLIERAGVPDHRITVVYPGIDTSLFRPPDAGASARADPSNRPYVLCVSGGDPTKNVETLIDAFARLPSAIRDEHDLLLAGDLRKRGDLRARVAERGIAAQTSFPGLVSDEQLVRLYQRASLFVFPSKYEGFGLPVLEAMACGCPVISSNASSLPEVAGEAGLLLDPSDIQGFAQAMERVIAARDLRHDLGRRGLAQAARFSWDRTARETVAVYEKVASS